METTYLGLMHNYNMKQNTKDWIHYGMAVTFLVSAIVLAFVSFIALRHIHNTVLVYVGEASTFTAAVFGIALVARHEIDKRVDEIRREMRGGGDGD